MNPLKEILLGPEQPQITNHGALESMIRSTYVLGVVVSIGMVIIAALVAKRIMATPGRADISKRKKWFWALSAVAPIVLTVYNFFMVAERIPVLSMLNKFQKNAGIAVLVMFLTYLILGLILSFLGRKGKLGDWFFKSKEYK